MIEEFIIDKSILPKYEFFHNGKEHDTIITKSCMGTGKTKNINELIKTNIYKKILIVSFRITLDEEYVRNFEDFKLYSKIDSKIYDMEDHNKLVVQIDSLHKIRGSCDLLILDEFTYTSTHLVEYVKNKTESYDTFINYINLSPKVIVSDAYLTNDDINWINLFRKNILYIKNEYKKHKDKKIINFKTNSYEFVNSILNDLENNKKVILATNKKGFSDYLKFVINENKKICNKNYKFIDAENSHDVDIKNWDKYDLISYTPTIVAGLSFEKKHYDTCYGYFINSSSSAELCVQQLFRVRDIGSKEINLCFEITGKKDYPVTYEDIKKYILSQHMDLNKGLNNIKLNRFTREIIEDDYFELYINTKKKIFLSRNEIEKTMLYLLKIQGIENIEEINGNSNNNKIFRKNYSDFNKIKKEKNIDRMLSLPKLEFNEYEELNNNYSRKTLDEKLQCIYYNLCNSFTVNELNKEEIIKYERKIQIFNNLKFCKQNENNICEALTIKINENEEYLEKQPNTVKLHNNNKYYKLSYCIEFLLQSGFDGVFDKNEIVLNEGNLINYFKKNGKKISSVFIDKNKDWENENNIKDILKYINTKLNSMLKIKIVTKDKKSNKYIITGLDFWDDKINPFKETDIDMLLKEILNEFNNSSN